MQPVCYDNTKLTDDVLPEWWLSLFSSTVFMKSEEKQRASRSCNEN